MRGGQRTVADTAWKDRKKTGEVLSSPFKMLLTIFVEFVVSVRPVSDDFAWARRMRGQD